MHSSLCWTDKMLCLISEQPGLSATPLLKAQGGLGLKKQNKVASFEGPKE